MQEGISGKIARSFIQSKLTILLMLAFLLIGGYSTMLMPREEEPQIEVPMTDIFIGFPGATPKEVETKISAPLEKMISNIQEIRARKGNVIAIATQGDREIAHHADHVVAVPAVDELTISVFTYEPPALVSWLQVLEHSPQPVRLLIPNDRTARMVAAYYEHPG